MAKARVKKGNPIAADVLAGKAAIGRQSHSKENGHSYFNVKQAFWRGAAHWHFDSAQRTQTAEVRNDQP
jgi:hypothetical protein